MTNPTPPRSSTAVERPAILSELSDIITEGFLGEGVPLESARSRAECAVESIRLHFGGSQLFIPMGKRQELAVRNAEIRRDMKAGVPWKDLRRKHGLSDQTLRRIASEEE